MAQPRAERLMNLHILLLGAKRFIGKDAIRDAVYPEHARGPAGDEAFERAFERDKDALRQIGAVIEVGSADAFFDDEIGYRIPTEQTSLPEIRFESDEAAVLGLAAKVWQQATLAKATARALRQAQGAGRRDRPRPARGRRAGHHRRRAGLRAAVGRGRQASPGQLPLPARQRVRADHAARPAVGPGPLLGSLVRRRLRRRPRRRARLPALADRGPGAGERQVRCLRRAARHRRTRRGSPPVTVVPVGAGRAAGPPGDRRGTAATGRVGRAARASRAGTPSW